MSTENGLLVDLSDIREIVTQGDVFTIAFRLFPERLIIDTRFDEKEPEGPSGTPMVAIVDPVATVQERFFWLGQHRPSLGLPEDFRFLFWPHSIRYLEESGIWQLVRERLGATRFHRATATCDDALDDLLRRERGATIEAIRGERHHTIWSAVTN